MELNTGQDEGDRITLVVTGTTGTWTQVETDGGTRNQAG